MDSYAIEEKLEKGYMHCRVIINMVGKPREHVEKILEKSLEKLNEEKGVEVIEQKSYPGKEQDNFFSAFSDVELLLKDFATLNRICFIYMPSSLELIRPENFRLASTELGNFVNDLLSMMHEIDLQFKSTSSANEVLERNLRNLLKNSLLNSLDSGKKPVEELSKSVGIIREQLMPFLEEFSKEGLVTKQGDEWEKARHL